MATPGFALQITSNVFFAPSVKSLSLGKFSSDPGLNCECRTTVTNAVADMKDVSAVLQVGVLLAGSLTAVGPGIAMILGSFIAMMQ